MNTPTNPITSETVAATAFALLSPRFSINKTAGFKPIAKKSEITIRTNT